ncbi:MAG: ATP-binding protein [Pseudohongiellaceae bacterium]
MIKRQLSQQLFQALQSASVVYLNGPRQAGKTTLVRALAKGQWPAEYVSFDEASMLGAAESDPEAFLRAYEGRLILDEVQMAPALFRPLKLLVDEVRTAKPGPVEGRFLLTGSANVMALPTLANALVGRMNVLGLYPLSAVEVLEGKGGFLECLMRNAFKPRTLAPGRELTDVIQQATFPEISTSSPAVRRRWFESYITTILQRDVRQIADIAKLGLLPNLLKVLASRAGGLINEADIARSIGQNAVTTKNYRVLLQMMFLVFELKPWYRNIGKRLVKAGKGYVIDSSMLCHLQQIDLEKAARSDPHVFGHVLENFVASELVKQLAASEIEAELFHFRTSDGKEVDFVLEQANGKLAGIEVKGRGSITADDFKGLQVLRSHTAADFVCGIVLYRGRKVIPFGESMWAVPMDMLWNA